MGVSSTDASGILGGVPPVLLMDGFGIVEEGRLAGISISGFEEVENVGSETCDTGGSVDLSVPRLGLMLSREEDETQPRN